MTTSDDSNYRLGRKEASKEQEFINQILTHVGNEFSGSDSCGRARRSIQNEWAAAYYAPDLRYIPQERAGDAKEDEIIKSLYQKIKAYFTPAPEKGADLYGGSATTRRSETRGRKKEGRKPGNR